MGGRAFYLPPIFVIGKASDVCVIAGSYFVIAETPTEGTCVQDTSRVLRTLNYKELYTIETILFKCIGVSLRDHYLSSSQKKEKVFNFKSSYNSEISALETKENPSHPRRVSSLNAYERFFHWSFYSVFAVYIFRIAS